MIPEVEHLTFDVADVTIHAVAAGPQEGPLAILLHGFPEFWYGWRHQITPLAKAGLRVVAPDQRGYNQSSKPADWQAYKVANLVGDVLGIADSLERDHFMLAGHDWGGIVAFACAMGHQYRVDRLAVLNAPHPSVFWNYLRDHPAQVLRSWYVFFLQLPRLPEFLFEAGNFRMMTETLGKTSRPGTFSSEDFEAYREAWRQPGAPTGMINWYRALRASTPSSNPTLEIPARILWGARDRFLALDLAERSLRYCQRGKLTVFPEATHWLQHEEAATVSNALTEFFTGAGEA